MSNWLTPERVYIRVDAEGRVVRTPAIDKLLVAVRRLELAFGSWDEREEHECVRAVLEALEEVDREAELMGATAAESSDSEGLPNKVAAAPSDGVRETRKPPITGASGAETPARALSSADLEKEDRRCKK